MSELRRDIAEAAGRMAVTFGTRSAMRDLAEELGPAEQVVELAACTYAGAAGLVALTTQRVIAIRDDYSKHQVQFVVVAEVVTVDYEPTVHDGFALFTATGRLVVRKMRREDGDRLVDALLTRAPHIVIQVTRPVGAPPTASAPQLGRLGRHRKPASPQDGTRPAARLGPAVAAQASAAQGAAQAAGQHTSPPPGPGPMPPAAPVAVPTAYSPAPAPAVAPVPAAAASVSAPPSAPSGAPGAPARAAAGRSASAPEAEAGPGGTRPATDKEILLGVLADLHAQGVLTADEFATKVRQIVGQG